MKSIIYLISLKCSLSCSPLDPKLIFGDCFCIKGVIFVLPEFKNKELPKAEPWHERKSRGE